MKYVFFFTLPCDSDGHFNAKTPYMTLTNPIFGWIYDIRVYRYVDNISQELIGKLMIIDWLGGEQSRPEKCSWAKEM